METDTVERFIVGVSRGGTTWLSRVLNTHPDVICFGETAFWGRRYVEPNAQGLYDAQALERVRLMLRGMHPGPEGDAPGSLPPQIINQFASIVDEAVGRLAAPVEPGSVFASLGERLRAHASRTASVEKTPHHLNHIDRILDQLPQARFVVMLREPYSFMVSYKFQGQQLGSQTRAIFDRLYHPLVPALVWRRYWRSAQDATRRYPDRVCLVMLSDLKRSADAVVCDVLRFFDLAPVDGLAARVPPDNSSFPSGVRPEPDPEDIACMNIIARREIAEAGCELRPVRHERLLFLRSVLRLPGWALRNARVLNRAVEGSVIRYAWRIIHR